jgi:hypothetical protein
MEEENLHDADGSLTGWITILSLPDLCPVRMALYSHRVQQPEPHAYEANISRFGVSVAQDQPVDPRL